MKLVDVNAEPLAKSILYELLAQREPDQSISHGVMPSFEEHCAFCDSRPHEAWYLIQVDPHYVGSVYLTKKREIGIFIFEGHKGNGFGEAAVRMLMEKHPGECLANVNPANEASSGLFQKLGGRLIQHTYRLTGAST
jgi:RimJ/RimL family protein N-acetyltransferase